MYPASCPVYRAQFVPAYGEAGRLHGAASRAAPRVLVGAGVVGAAGDVDAWISPGREAMPVAMAEALHRREDGGVGVKSPAEVDASIPVAAIRRAAEVKDDHAV